MLGRGEAQDAASPGGGSRGQHMVQDAQPPLTAPTMSLLYAWQSRSNCIQARGSTRGRRCGQNVLCRRETTRHGPCLVRSCFQLVSASAGCSCPGLLYTCVPATPCVDWCGSRPAAHLDPSRRLLLQLYQRRLVLEQQPAVPAARRMWATVLTLALPTHWLKDHVKHPLEAQAEQAEQAG